MAGTLLGHIVPGTIFTLLAMWWAFDYLRVYFRARLSGEPYRSNPKYADPRRRTAGRTLPHTLPPLDISLRFIAIIGGEAV